MLSPICRQAASNRVRASFIRGAVFSLLASLTICVAAHAVVVRGQLTDALGRPVPGGRVQLIQDGQVAAFANAGADGSFEIRSGASGRFTLLGSSGGYLPAIGADFYGGTTDVLEQNVVLATNSVKQEISVSATTIPTPLPQLTAPVSILPGEALGLRVGLTDELRQQPGVELVQTGQTGGVTSLFVRGGNSTANLVTIDGIPAGDVGGTFDFGTVSSTAIGRVETVRGPDSAVYGTDAGAGVVAISTPRGTTLGPAITYSGDAGSLHTWRNEATVGGTVQKLDYFGAFSRFDTSNALALDRYHSATSAANVGYDFNGNTELRVTIRNADSATGVPGPHDFFGISNNANQKDQDLYSGATLENRYKGWHNLVRYGIARKREQEQQFGQVGTPIVFYPGTSYSYTEYFGNVVTITGANSYSVTGQTDIYGSNTDQASNRDQLYYQTDYTFSRHLTGLFGFRYDNERGSFNLAAYGEHEQTQRTNFEYNAQFQGEFFDRLFYSAGGSIEKNHLYGIAGTPRLGLAYVPVRSTGKAFHGTRFRANYATGVQEPTLALQYNSLYQELLAAGDTADIAAYHIGPQSAERSRTYDLGVDQSVFGEKLTLKAGYFHNVFDRQLESVNGQALLNYFGLTNPNASCGSMTPPALCNYYAYLNSLAYRAQGAELQLDWHPKPRFLVRGGYTYLDTRVVQSFASDAVNANQGFPTVNPNFPTVAIGAESPLVGARVFRRPPHTGYFSAQYTRPKFTLAVKGAMASRADDTTFLDYSDVNGGNTLLLPNRDLDFGFVKVDVGGTYALPHHVTFFTQVNNLTNNQHIGPIGYPGLPLSFRSGLKVRLGAE